MDPTYFKKIAELRGYRKMAAEEAPKLEKEPVQGVDYRSVEPTDEQKRCQNCPYAHLCGNA